MDSSRPHLINEKTPDNQACREKAITRLRRIVEERERELKELVALLMWMGLTEDKLEGEADELLWRLLHEVDRR